LSVIDGKIPFFPMSKEKIIGSYMCVYMCLCLSMSILSFSYLCISTSYSNSLTSLHIHLFTLVHVTSCCLAFGEILYVDMFSHHARPGL